MRYFEVSRGVSIKKNFAETVHYHECHFRQEVATG